MLILGLGSNVGDRLENLRKAYHAIKKLPNITIERVSPLYLSDALLPDNAPPDWDMPHLNYAIRCHSTCSPSELLPQLKNIEWSIGRKPDMRHMGPRILDIDILAWDNAIIATDVLTVPHRNLIDRPFALWPLADIAPLWQFPLPGENKGKTAAQLVEKWGSRFSREAPLRTVQLNQRVENPRLMGVVNVTPDSFSDGGYFLSSENALTQALALVAGGAEIIDIGAESTSPRAEPLNAATEWQRLAPVLTEVLAAKDRFLLPTKISIDTRHAEVAAKATSMGIDWINDVSGLDDPAMREVIQQANVDCVVMHHLNIPERRDQVLARSVDPVKTVYDWGMARLESLAAQGIPREKVIFDPGIGFGKMAEQSLILLQNIHVFKTLGARLLVGHSRKTFLSLLSKHPFAERDVETTAISLFLAKQQVDYLRIHNVEVCARALKVAAVIGSDSVKRSENN